MNKTKSKVLSLVLASAMIVSSFSSLNFASAATVRETGTITDDTKDTLYLASGTTNASAPLTALLGGVEIETYDHEDADEEEYDSSSVKTVSGDSGIISISNPSSGVPTLTVKANKTGKATLTVNYKGTYERDDKEVTVRASKEITVYVDEIGKDFLGEANSADVPAKRPADFEGAAANDANLEIGVYKAALKSGSDVEAEYAADATFAKTAIEVKKANKAFNDDKTELLDSITVATGVITIPTSYVAEDADPDKITEKLSSTGTATLGIKLDGTKSEEVKISVDKKIRALSGAEVNKKASYTFLTKTGASWDDDWKLTEAQDNCYSIKGYDVVAMGSLKVTNGTIGNVTAPNDTVGDITVEGGSVGDITEVANVTVEDGSVGTIKKVTGAITVNDGRVTAIDSKKATVTIEGGAVANSVVGLQVTINASDDEVNTSIGKDVTAKGNSTEDPTVTIGDSTSDATLKIGGTVKGIVTVSNDQAEIGAIDADYSRDVSFNDFTGKLGALKNTASSLITLDGESVVTVNAKLVADEVDIDEDSKLTVPEASVSTIDGEGGILAVPAGKLFVEDSMTDVTLVLTDGLVAGATAFTAYTDAVSVDDFTPLGYTLEQKSANKDTDKFVIKSVNFAGIKFDKTDLKIAKGYSDTITVKNYPDGTSLPTGATVEWNVDANDDYISVTTDGNTATIKALDFDADHAINNQGTITATVVDADGSVIEDLLEASINITAIEKPVSVVTLDTTKPVTVGTGAVYQYIANSSTGAVMSAASSDTQIATVELFNAADARGYKFQVKGVAEGTATITTTDANGATATLTVNVTKVNGTLKADTTTYTFAPGKVYDVKFSTTGTTAVPVVTVNGKVVSIAPRGNGVYRVTAQNAGTAYVVATVGNTHVSVKFVVAAGAASAGVTGNNVSNLK